MHETLKNAVLQHRIIHVCVNINIIFFTSNCQSALGSESKEASCNGIAFHVCI